jgi:predicted XRE-type DNA-binding protein
MSQLTYDNPFDVGAESQDEVTDITTRADLMILIRKHIKAEGWDQKTAARKLGTSQPRISNLLNGHIGKFSTGMLIDFLTSMGIQIKLTCYLPTDDTVDITIKGHKRERA